jgi:hypothetical protein
MTRYRRTPGVRVAPDIGAVLGVWSVELESEAAAVVSRYSPRMAADPGELVRVVLSSPVFFGRPAKLAAHAAVAKHRARQDARAERDRDALLTAIRDRQPGAFARCADARRYLRLLTASPLRLEAAAEVTTLATTGRASAYAGVIGRAARFAIRDAVAPSPLRFYR